MKNKILVTFIFGMIFFSLSCISSLESLGTFEQGEIVRVSQICNDATYMTLSSITYPNSSQAISALNMTYAGAGEFYYDFNLTSDTSGRYDVRGISDGCENTFATYFEITPSGYSGSSYIVFSTFVILFIYVFTFVSFFYARNIPLTILGGMAMLFLGIYTVQNGIIIFRDNLTNYISYVTIAAGAILALWAGYELYQDM